jgi:primosomal protein N' (replication factor Y) (superfamily II helicase)
VKTDKLKQIQAVLDNTPLWDEYLLHLLRWAAHYYHYRIGQVLAMAMPILLSQGHAAQLFTVTAWALTALGREYDAKTSKCSPLQQQVMTFLQQQHEAVDENHLLQHVSSARPALKALQKKGWIQSITRLPKFVPHNLITPAPQLNLAQQQAIAQVEWGRFQVYLLHGVTGSGKTEVYLQLIAQVLAQGGQALVLVPEINLTPQMLARFEARFPVPMAVLHSRLSERERLNAWLRARSGEAALIIGTRSAIWTPLARLGVIVVDEEHDLSYKQTSGFQYSGRDVAIRRAQISAIPIILGSATPALESFYNARQGRYHYLSLPQRAGTAHMPLIRVVDMRNQYAAGNLSLPLRQAIHACLEAKQQALLFIPRRGYAPALMCRQCGWVADCRHCSAHLTLHRHDGRLHCHHCGAIQPCPPLCPACAARELQPAGHGSERIEETLSVAFPHARILRIDSDSTRRKQAMHTMLTQIHAGEADILVGTHMLTKGHDFPQVTLVGIITLDGGLFSSDFRAPERTMQLLIQVAGRAGRAHAAGQVLLQTWHPHHPLLQQILTQGYAACAETLLQQRHEAALPPFSYLALLRAEALCETSLHDFMAHVSHTLARLELPELQLWGPVAAPLERKADHFRSQLLIQAPHRTILHHALDKFMPDFSLNFPKINWSLEVDPLDLA